MSESLFRNFYKYLALKFSDIVIIYMLNKIIILKLKKSERTKISERVLSTKICIVFLS
jgi:hypothetical protein